MTKSHQEKRTILGQAVWTRRLRTKGSVSPHKSVQRRKPTPKGLALGLLFFSPLPPDFYAIQSSRRLHGIFLSLEEAGAARSVRWCNGPMNVSLFARTFLATRSLSLSLQTQPPLPRDLEYAMRTTLDLFSRKSVPQEAST